jgi:hypothetical protein
MYSIETEVAALDEVAALPAQALPAYGTGDPARGGSMVGSP